MSEKKPFIKENIVRKTRIGRSFRRVIIILVSGILIGLIAVVTMVIAKPTAEKIFGQEETTTQEIVIIPRDEVPEDITGVTEESVTEEALLAENSSDVQSEENTESAETVEQEETTKPVEEIVQSAIEEYQYSIDDMTALWKNMSTLCDATDDSIVTVRSLSNETDWFDNEISNEGEFSGVVIAKTGYSTLILVPEEAVRDKDYVSVIWQNRFETRAKVEGADSISGLAVISVFDIALDDATKKIAEPIKLGNSYLVKRGDIMIAVGSPKGFPHSTAYTWASYVAKNEGTVDGQRTLIYTTEKCDSEKGTWFINSQGELIGWSVAKEPNNPHAETIVTGLSEYKTILEKMSNGSAYPYLGIEAIDVKGDTNLPSGIYVTEVVPDSPAYQAGIQPGDIITKVRDTSITAIGEYIKELEGLRPSDQAIVSVKRNGRDEYVDIDYELTVGKR